MDIWEANSISAAVTPHVCQTPEYKRCNGTECGDGDNRYGGLCDKDGCDLNDSRMGNPQFYGPGKTIDTTKPVTVVTQFLTDDGTANGTLKGKNTPPHLSSPPSTAFAPRNSSWEKNRKLF